MDCKVPGMQSRAVDKLWDTNIFVGNSTSCPSGLTDYALWSRL